MNDYIDKMAIKGRTFNNSFRHSMASEAKGHLYKGDDNPMKCMLKKFRNNVMNGS